MPVVFVRLLFQIGAFRTKSNSPYEPPRFAQSAQAFVGCADWAAAAKESGRDNRLRCLSSSLT